MAIGDRLRAAAAVARTTMVPFERPDRMVRALMSAAPWGVGLAGLFAASTGRYPRAIALVDDDGPVTYKEMWNRSGDVAAGLRSLGATSGSGVGIMCRNHRGFVEAAVGAARTGANIVLLNTGFSGPQLADVAENEGVGIIVHDDEFAEAVGACSSIVAVDESRRRSFSSPSGGPSPTGGREGRIVILTSGTTGRPKGAVRQSSPTASAGAAGLLVRIPLRPRDVQVVPSPFFHAWGLSHLMLGVARSATTVTARRFDPAATLDAIERHRADVLAVVPVMLQRVVSLGPERLSATDTSSLRVIAVSGSALGGKLATEALDQFGPVLYNTYGSTEVAVASIATPDELRRRPTTVGSIAPGVRVEILDADGRPVPDGTVGRIFVGNDARFEGYTSGGTKEVIRGLMSSGDLGHLENGLLFVDGRDDDMVISGGENLFPGEVEDLLLHHPHVADAAVVGVPDDEFGQVLAAYVVRRPGSTLDADAVRNHVRENLAKFKVPKRVEFVEEIPRNPTGKILRRRLREG
jgi:fatty-acyl-CoA synthase